MPGMVLTVAESLKLATPMTFDALTFVIMRKLSSVRHKLKVGLLQRRRACIRRSSWS